MRRLSVFLLFLLVLGLSGCVSMQGQGFQTQSLEPSAMVRFSDIPFPAGFRLLADKSFILESGGVRAGVLRYTGRADPVNVVLFYKAQMPAYNWALLNILEYGDHMLNFERENESCVITIKARGRKTQITVSLAPKTPIPMSGEKEGKQRSKQEQRK